LNLSTELSIVQKRINDQTTELSAKDELIQQETMKRKNLEDEYVDQITNLRKIFKFKLNRK
jgi:hypothetical protein